MPSTNESYIVYCDSCHLDDIFPTQEHASKMQIYHDALFDCEDSASKVKADD